MVSVNQLSTFSHLNMSKGRHQNYILIEFTLVNICSEFAMLRNTRGIEKVMDHPFSIL